MTVLLSLLACVGARQQLEVATLENALLQARLEQVEADRDRLAEEHAALQQTCGRQDPARATEALRAAEALEAEGDLDGAREAYRAVSADFGRTPGGARATQRLAELELVGRPAPPLTVDGWFGEAGGLDGVTVVVFWEQWCPHCVREMPTLQGLYQDLAAQGLNVVGVTRMSKGTTDADVRAFLEANAITFPNAWEAGVTTEAYAVLGVPAAAVVRDGEVVWRGHPAKLSREVLSGWLNP